jgi:protein involved in polysaccharide export with SLBB domain
MGLVLNWRRRSLLCAFIFTGAAAVVPSLRAQDVKVGETPQQANERIRALSMGAKNTPHDYIIGEGDLLDISVFDVPELTRSVRVSQTGTISIPLVPVRLQVSGLTESQAEQKIAEVLESNGLVSHPEVGVMVREHKSKPITIVGAVAHPMVYEADRQVTLLEALAEAGGVSADAGDTVIVTRLHAATFLEMHEGSSGVNQPSSAPPGSGEPPSLDNPPAAAPSTQQTPGNDFPAPAVPPATLPPTGVSSQAGSNSPNPASTLTINVNELLETGDTRNNIVLQAGDVVTVPHAGIIYVLGAVARPGGFVLSNDRGQLTTMKVLSLAGGTTNIAKLDHAVIIRKDNQGKQSETEVDLKRILHRESEDLQMRPSDVLYIPDNRTKQILLRTAELAVALGSAVAIYRLAYH